MFHVYDWMVNIWNLWPASNIATSLQSWRGEKLLDWWQTNLPKVDSRDSGATWGIWLFQEDLLLNTAWKFMKIQIYVKKNVIFLYFCHKKVLKIKHSTGRIPIMLTPNREDYTILEGKVTNNMLTFYSG